jgi:hypothetical protein
VRIVLEIDPQQEAFYFFARNSKKKKLTQNELISVQFPIVLFNFFDTFVSEHELLMEWKKERIKENSMEAVRRACVFHIYR